MMTDNIGLHDEDPSACLDMSVPPESSKDIQRCIRTVHQGLQWAELFNIRGGYAGTRRYNQTFLIEDQNIIGIFDDRNHNLDHHKEKPKTIEDLMQIYQCGYTNIKTLVVFEKPELRLANSDERCRQSYFISETIYPAFAAIMEVLNYAHTDSQNNSNENYSTKIRSIQRTVNKGSSFLKRNFFYNVQQDPIGADKVLIKKSPLELFFSSDSLFNLDINNSIDRDF